MTISRADALRVAADVLERSYWLTVDLLADQGDEHASENAARIVEILRELAREEGTVPATVPPPSGATGATTSPPLADVGITRAGSVVTVLDADGRVRPEFRYPSASDTVTYATGGPVGPVPEGSIRATLQAASDRHHAWTPSGTVEEPLEADLPGMWERADYLGGSPDVVRTSGPLDPEIHAALVRSVERGRREAASGSRETGGDVHAQVREDDKADFLNDDGLAPWER